MKVEIWLDIVCPWCYIGKRRFEAALERFEHADEVEVSLRAFELDPEAPPTSDTSVAEILADKYGGGLERAQAMIDDVTEVAAEEGLEYRLDVARRGNTFDAHRLVKLADEHDASDAMAERLMRAYFTEAKPIDDRATLAALAGEVGIDVEAAHEALSGDAYADAVRDDERTAARLGLRGVPGFVFDRRTGFTGAHPAETILRALRSAWEADATARSA